MSGELWLRIPGVSTNVFAFQIRFGRWLAGKSEECDIRISHWSLCPSHALLSYNLAGELRIIDLSSQHGTHVDGTEILETELQPGSLVRLGQVMLEIIFDPSEIALHREEPEHQPEVSLPRLLQPLSKAQQRIAMHLTGGLSEKSIARELHLSPHT
ncbi:unnamed protein product, partial [marine sediment metagenome]